MLKSITGSADWIHLLPYTAGIFVPVVYLFGTTDCPL